MPQEGQKTITLNEETVDSIQPVADKNGRSVANIVKLCIEYQFGSKESKAKAKDILESLIK